MDIQRTANTAADSISDRRLGNPRPDASGRMTAASARDLASRAPSISALRPSTPQIDTSRGF